MSTASSTPPHDTCSGYLRAQRHTSTNEINSVRPYQPKADGFLPGGSSLHTCMTPHGPDTKTYEVTIPTKKYEILEFL
ncbi:Homogentisate 1,2-dioxygenase [Trema orientale]|uniref:Homogentisate 1,2-dioxygenase n=1 Tax=Trema orientale TaxID=63057 RepID=A0A2P5FKS4_TREOI|nr:Homogentisate 1,2-dioxygenase [Trema orientale]